MRNEVTKDRSTTASSEIDLRKAAELLVEMEAARDAIRNNTAKKSSHASRRENGQTINLIELMYYLVSKCYVIFVFMAIGSLLMGWYASRESVPIYTAVAKLYIMGSNGSGIVSLTDLQIGTSLTMDYQEVFSTWEVHEMVNEILGTDYPYTQLQSKISVFNPEDTRILRIYARDTDAQHASDIANAYVIAGKRFIMETMDTGEPTTFSLALVPSAASSISVTNYALRGLILGAAISISILTLLFMLDNRPKSIQDMTRYGGDVPVLAVIPKNVYLSGKKGRNRRRGDENDE